MSLEERPIHPAARAFFDALTDQQIDSKRSCRRRKSESILKRTQTLGWRNRYSQAKQFPVTLVTTVKSEKRSFTVKQVQRGEVEGTYGTGATVWPASMVLLKYLERHAEALVSGKDVVDLGAGTGITSIGAALFGGSRVVCTDGCENVVQLAKENVYHAGQQLSGPPLVALKASTSSTTTIGECKVNVRQYLWGDGTFEKEKFDLILVSDCVLPKLYPIEPLVNALDELFRADSVAILSYEHRYYPDFDPRVKFQELAKSKGMLVSVIPFEQQDPVYSVEDIELWEVRRK